MTVQLGFLIAFLAGLLSFFSPCVLPLIPSYLSLVGGVSYRDLQAGGVSRYRVFRRTLLFVLGFSLVFVGLGVLFSGAAGFLGSAARIIDIVAGSLIILLGLNFIFDFWKLLNMEKRFHLRRAPAGAAGSLLLGMAFAAGWTPCVGPILASILFLAGTSGRILRGSLLLATYSAGLGLPFLLSGFFFSLYSQQADKIKPHLNKIRIFSGIFLTAIGLLVLLGRLQRLNVALFALAGRLMEWHSSAPQQTRWAFGFFFFGVFLILAACWLRGLIRHRRRRRPVLLSFGALTLALAVLSFTAVIDPAAFLTSWLVFQGL
jgi:cytochrome c-type biogenesis protein